MCLCVYSVSSKHGTLPRQIRRQPAVPRTGMPVLLSSFVWFKGEVIVFQDITYNYYSIKGCYYSEDQCNRSSSDPQPIGLLESLEPLLGRISKTSFLWRRTGAHLGGPVPRLSPRARRSNLSAGEGSNALESWYWGSAQNSGTPWRWPCDPEERNRRHSQDDAGDPGQRSSLENRDPAHHRHSATSASLYAVDKEGDVTSCAIYNWSGVTIMSPAPLKKYHLKSSGEKVAASMAVGRWDQRWRRGRGPPTLPSVDTVQYMLPRNTNTVSFWSKCRLKGGKGFFPLFVQILQI